MSLIAARRPLTDFALAALAAAGLIGLGVLFAPWGGLVFLSWPPLLALTYRQGWRWGGALALLAAAGLWLIVPSLLVVPLLVFMAGPVWSGWRLKGAVPLGQVLAESVIGQIGLLLLWAALWVLLSRGLGGFAAAFLAGLQQYAGFAQSTAQAVRATALASGAGASQAAAEGQFYLQELRAYLPIMPAVAATGLLVNSAIGLLLGEWTLRGIKEAPPALPAFGTWSSPPWLAIAYLVGLALFFLGPQNSTGNVIGANLLTVSQAVLLVHGGALLYAGAARLGLGRGLRVVGLALVLLIPVSSEILAVLGVVDSALDMRRLRTEKA